MNINATLLGQMITFSVFIGFTMKYVWPPVTAALAQRQKRIADGLAAAERGKHDLELAQHKAVEQLREAKSQAAKIIEQAHLKAAGMVEEGKERAREEGQHLKLAAKAEIEQEVRQTKDELRKHVARIAMQGAEKILQQQLNPTAHQGLIDKIIDEI
ncbi:MAG: F0F1 ATP synthase subunit B [Gammaproteobacteria bacterium]|nr:F0F1 ATP synthase subunit B [Gammaproteobacteria bacterium]